MFRMSFISSFATIILSSFFISSTNAHGYLKTPRARNVVANEEGYNWDPNSNKELMYPKEYCPHCLNLGGLCGVTGSQDYALPKSVTKKTMLADPQLILDEDSRIITAEVVLTAHHKGHFEFKACPVSSPEEAPTQECFDRYPLTLVSDELYGSLPDGNYPSRAYIPLNSYSNLQQDDESAGSLYRYKLQLPSTLNNGGSSLVLLQWHYLTANSCKYDGYNEYDFPADWGNMGYEDQGLCQMPLPADGRGLPEQFWNCAEIRMGNTPPSENASIGNNQAPPPTKPSVEGTCGGGNRGNGICPNPTKCCSSYGYCGSSPAHCLASASLSQQSENQQYCGDGYINTGKCRDPQHCCSRYGYCGSTAAYCGRNPQYYPSWASTTWRSNNEKSSNNNNLRRRNMRDDGENNHNDGS